MMEAKLEIHLLYRGPRRVLNCLLKRGRLLIQIRMVAPLPEEVQNLPPKAKELDHEN